MDPREELTPAELGVVSEFLACVFHDHEAGRELGLAHYLARFPGHERLIEREFAALTLSSQDGDTVGDVPQETLGGFALERELGRGGQGRVYLARELASGRRFALKVWNASVVLDPLGRLRMQREVEVLARLAHPGLACRVALGEERGVPFVVMEYIDGASVAELVRRQASASRTPWPLEERLRLVEAAARAAHAAHEAGVVHRDIKPSNVILRRDDGRPVLIDFGLALADGSAHITGAGQHVGTPAYLPPEVLRGERFDRRGDVYMLGALLYEVLTLRPPFEARSRLTLYEHILEREPVDPRRLVPGLSVDLAVVVASALAKEPEQRYATAAELADDLERVRGGLRPRIRPPGPLARVRRLCRRRPRIAAGFAALLLGSMAVALTFQDLTARTQARLARVERAALVRSATSLAGEAEAADWPELPAAVSAMEAWLAQVAPIHTALVRASAEDDSFGAEQRPLLARLAAVEGEVARRRDLVARSTGDSVTCSDAWTEAARVVAASPLYGGWTLEPQLGLVPLGLDPHSGLLECVHLRSGTVPKRDPRTGELGIGPESGLVFVLLPGGAFPMGSEPPSARHPAGSPNVDERATDTGEWPIRSAHVGPCFLSKYEMTQGQWLRLAGSNPSRWQPGRDAHDPISLAHPVENVSWRAARSLLARFGLELPTEAQWEYAARAGTGTPWSTGEESGSLGSHANLADRKAVVFLGEQASAGALAFDGHVEHAAVGSFLPNGFGLHDMHGNVWEWCADVWAFPEGNPDRATPTTADGGPMRVLRGGGYDSSPWDCRSARRDYAGEHEATFARGVRPARPLSGGTALAFVEPVEEQRRW